MNLNIYIDGTKDGFLYSKYSPEISSNSKSQSDSNTNSSTDSPNSQTLIISGFKNFDNKSSITLHKKRLIYEIILLTIYLLIFLLSTCFILRNLYNRNKYGVFGYINIVCTLLTLFVIVRLSRNIIHNRKNDYPVQRNKLYNVVYISAFLILYVTFFVVNNIIIEIQETTRDDWKQNLDINFLRISSGFIIFLLFVILFLYWILVNQYNDMIRKRIHKHGIII